MRGSSFGFLLTGTTNTALTGLILAIAQRVEAGLAHAIVFVPGLAFTTVATIVPLGV